MRPLPRRPLALPAVACAALALVAGCGGPPAPPPPPDAPPGYVQLRETFGPRDFGPLRGRRVVLDPGHGGFFRGAVGPGGLAEADVNLGVALHLRGLLEWAGAEVAMTRTADYDFLTPADSTLVSDLAFRVSFTDSIEPDVFLSIHHNSTATADPTVNETQTYYPLGDDGASVDLARAIHRHLVLNLEITPAKILPGNFHVLRHATVPAVLGEPAMISHPVMEGRLSQAAAQRLEAEAYFLGLLAYFAGGDPRWAAAQPETVMVAERDTVLAWSFRDRGSHAPAPDPASFTVRVDGVPVDHRLSPDGATVRFTCPPPRHGETRRVQIGGRNLAGRRAPHAVTVVVPAAAPLLEVAVLSEAPSHQPRRAHLACAAPDGRPLPAGALGWPAQGPAGLLDLGTDTAGVVQRGAGPPVFVATGPGRTRLQVTEAELAPQDRLLPVPGAGPRPWHDRLEGPAPARAALVGGIVHTPGAPLWRQSPGRLPLVKDAGFADLPVTFPLVPGLDGATVVIDPAGGGSTTDGAGPLGLRGADVNLEVARHLARLLEGCGARAVLTRGEGDAPTPTAKVALAGAVGADWFLTIGRAAPGAAPGIGHHPASLAGRAWAGHAAAAVAALLPRAPAAAAASWAYLLRHTACPALEILLPGPDDTAAERRLGRPAWQAVEARALLLGLAAAAGGGPAPAADPASILAQLPGAPAPAAVTWALWDGNLPWYPLPESAGPQAGASVSSWGEPGLPASGRAHILEVHTAGTWQLWRLERTGIGTWTGDLAASGRQETAPDHE